jgi:hypothetical protein
MSDKYPTEPDNFPKKGTSGSGGLIAYSVEARYAFPSPKVIAGMTLDARWQKVQFTEAAMGVPIGRSYNDPWLRNTGLLGYQAAQALRWWFLAHAEAELSCLCVETRLIEHKIEYSYSETAQKAAAHIGVGESRSNIMPVDSPAIPQT